MYELKWDKKALDFLNKLEKDIKKRIWDKIQACKINPFRYLEHLEEIEGFKLRVGDYRILFLIKGSRLIVIKIGHRKNIYY